MNMMYTLGDLSFSVVYDKSDKYVTRLHVWQYRLGAVTTEVAVERDASILCPEFGLEANSTSQQKRLFLTACPQLLPSLIPCLQLHRLGRRLFQNSLIIFENVFWKRGKKCRYYTSGRTAGKTTTTNHKFIQGHFTECRALWIFLSAWTRWKREGQVSMLIFLCKSRGAMPAETGDDLLLKFMLFIFKKILTHCKWNCKALTNIYITSRGYFYYLIITPACTSS